MKMVAVWAPRPPDPAGAAQKVVQAWTRHKRIFAKAYGLSKNTKEQQP